MLLSVLFLIMYSVNSLRTGLIALSERQQAQKKIDELASMTSLSRFQSIKAAYSTNHKEAKKLKAELDKLNRLEREAKEIKEKQKKLYMIAIDREINLKKYRTIIQDSIYSHYAMKNELSAVSVQERDSKRSANVFQQKLAAVEAEKELMRRELDFYKSQEVDYFNDLTVKKRTIATITKSTVEMEKKYKKRTALFEKISKNLERQKKDNYKLQQEYEEKIARINRQKESDLDKLQEKVNAILNEKHRVEIANSKIRKTIQKIEKQLLQTKQTAEKLKGQNQVVRLLNGQLSAALEEKKSIQSRLDDLRVELQTNRKSLSLAKEKSGALQKWLANFAVQNLGLQREVANYREKELNEKEQAELKNKLVERIKRSFDGVDLETKINHKNGELILNFKKIYFDYGKSELKDEMKEDLKDFISRYAVAVMGDPNIANFIQDIEISGSASPTYKGRFVNLKYSDDQTIHEAMNLNLNLSYNRAKNIFDYLFNSSEVEFKYKSQMLPLIKVSGEGFHRIPLPRGQTFESIKESDRFCDEYDCNIYQNVKISFRLK